MTLQEFKQDCIRRHNERLAREADERTRKSSDLEKLRTDVLAAAVRQVGQAIPEELREFVAVDGEEPTEKELRAFPNRFFPTIFKVEAPGLLPIHFTTSTKDRVSQVTQITVGLNKFGDDWFEAVFAALIPEVEEEQGTGGKR